MISTFVRGGVRRSSERRFTRVYPRSSTHLTKSVKYTPTPPCQRFYSWQKPERNVYSGWLTKCYGLLSVNHWMLTGQENSHMLGNPRADIIGEIKSTTKSRLSQDGVRPQDETNPQQEIPPQDETKSQEQIASQSETNPQPQNETKSSSETTQEPKAVEEEQPDFTLDPIPAPPRPPVDPSLLRWKCEDNMLPPFEDTNDPSLVEYDGIIGQERAFEAFELGITTEAEGFNMFVTGLTGNSMSVVNSFLDKFQETLNRGVELKDIILVHNFSDPDCPRHIALPAGQGRQFAVAMDSLITELNRSFNQLFESPSYAASIKKIKHHYNKKRDELRAQIYGQSNFILKNKGEEYCILLTVGEKEHSVHDLDVLVENGILQKEEASNLSEQLSRIREIENQKMQEIDAEYCKEIEEVDKQVISTFIRRLIARLETKFNFSTEITDYLKDVESYLTQEVIRVKSDRIKHDVQVSVRTTPDSAFKDYRVNVLVDNSRQRTKPVIFEMNPTYSNLFGRTGVGESDQWKFPLKVDHMSIYAGSLLKANGGILVINAGDAFHERSVWSTLMRSLRNGQVELGTDFGRKPPPIPIKLKVIVIGSNSTYQILSDTDADFRKLFKVRVPFDYEVELNESTIHQLARFIKSRAKQNNTLPFSRRAVARIIEHVVRSAGCKFKLCAERTLDISDVIVESSYWATKSKSSVVTESHVKQALDAKIKRESLFRDKRLDSARRGDLLIQCTGTRVGQVNALTVIQAGPNVSFGYPSRVTAVTGIGSDNVLHIEKESRLTGKIHTKGVLILTNYLRYKYAQPRSPIAMAASLAYEQNYAHIDGDSASSTEIYAIISSLSGIPIKQGIAVTGSVSQHGEIQIIGGVNEKIEGFFDFVKTMGPLTGEHGVMIPEANVPYLMLREDVVQACKDKLFNIYAVKTIDEGLEVLTGVKAGKIVIPPKDDSKETHTSTSQSGDDTSSSNASSCDSTTSCSSINTTSGPNLDWLLYDSLSYEKRTVNYYVQMKLDIFAKTCGKKK